MLNFLSIILLASPRASLPAIASAPEGTLCQSSVLSAVALWRRLEAHGAKDGTRGSRQKQKKKKMFYFLDSRIVPIA